MQKSSMAFCLALLTLAGCGGDAPNQVAVRTVLVQTAGSASEAGRMQLTGEVRARHEVDLAFRVGGKVVARLVDAGATVKPGLPLARLDPADLALAQQSARAQLAAAESDAATARADRERYADLQQRKFVSQAAFEAKDNAARAAAARLEQARAQAAVSGNQLAYGALSADQTGVITAVLADVGQVVAAGQPVLRLARPDEKEVAVAVPENRVAELHAAKSMTVTFWAAPELKLRGELRELSPAADAASRTYAARIRILQPPPVIQLGMTARVEIEAPTAGDEIRLPLTAVFDQGQGPSVWMVVDNKLQRQAVTVKQFRQDSVLLAGGLRGGELVVVAGTQRLAEGQAVQPQKIDAGAGK